ncbi:MAG: beta-N-acetylhexosaminidase [Candidatus Lokiarchaeota archaeon]|nr:beta-N-acetylhexosaminidase [Candidatus Lokiarchaeota archaeon]
MKIMNNNTLKIIPEPVKSSINDGKFFINSRTKLISNDLTDDVLKFLRKFLKDYKGLNLNQEEFSHTINYDNAIILKVMNSNKTMQKESYTLQISKALIEITAGEVNGIFYGIQTLIQIIFLENIVIDEKSETITLPCLKISDYPRFKWRGFMLDEARHFFGKETIKKLLDLMALLKFNIFHWHLTDDQGWRIEIKKYSLLTEIGSKREGTIVPNAKIARSKGKRKVETDNIPVDGFYTQEDLKEIIQYANERYITIIPEIDFPGHVVAALASYPKLSCNGGPFKVSSLFGVHKDVFCIGNEQVFEFSKDVLKEVMKIFPSKYLHVGGDEVPTRRWNTCEKCQTRIAKEGLNNTKELQEYYTSRICSFLKSHEHILIGWNEILYDNLDIDAVCQYWTNNFDLVLDHIKKGRKVIMSEMSTIYLNYPIELTPLRKTYEYDPLPTELEENYVQNVLGLEACLWTEIVKDSKMVELRIIPRLLAVGEIGWSPKEVKNFERFEEKLNSFYKILDYYKIGYD